MSDPNAGQYAAGVIIALFSTLASALGLLLQKLAHKAIARSAAAAEVAAPAKAAPSASTAAASAGTAGGTAASTALAPTPTGANAATTTAVTHAPAGLSSSTGAAPDVGAAGGGDGAGATQLPPAPPAARADAALLPLSGPAAGADAAPLPSSEPALLADAAAPSCSVRVPTPPLLSPPVEEWADAFVVSDEKSSSAAQAKSASSAAKRPYFTHPLWLLGLLSLVVHTGLALAVLDFLGQSRAAAMGSITILWNGALAAGCLGERFTAWDGLSTTIIVTGAVISLIFGSSGNSSQPVTSLASFISIVARPIDYIGGAVVFVVAAASWAGIRTIAARGAARTPGQIRLECYLRILISALGTGLTGMVATAVINSIGGAVRTADAASIFTAWQFYILVIALVLSLILQLGFLNSALRQLDALEIIPPYQAGVVIVGIAWGMVFTDDA